MPKIAAGEAVTFHVEDITETNLLQSAIQPVKTDGVERRLQMCPTEEMDGKIDEIERLKRESKARKPSQMTRKMTVELGFLAEEPVLLVQRKGFCAFMSVLTLAVMVELGLEADLKCRYNCGPGVNAIWANLDHAFTVLCIADVAVAIYSLKPKNYFRGLPSPNKKVNLDLFRSLDFLLVFLRAIDIWLLSPVVGVQTYLKYFSAFRVMHLANFAKEVQLVRGFRELWLIMAGMGDTIRTVFWVFGMLMLVSWVFAVIMTVVINDGVTVYNYSSSFWQLEDYWSTVPKSLLTLFQVLTRDKWSGTVMWPLIEANTAIINVLILFLCIASLALLNTVVGVVVESTLRSSRENDEKNNREKEKQEQKTLNSLKRIFHEADEDGTGELTIEEMENAIRNPAVRKVAFTLGIPMSDLHVLKAMLFRDEELVKSDNFFQGCLRLRGDAMARDLQHVGVDMGRHDNTALKHLKMLRQINNDIAGVLDAIDEIDTDIIRDPKDERDPVLMGRRGRSRVQRGSMLRQNKAGEMEYASTAGSSELGAAAHTGRMADVGCFERGQAGSRLDRQRRRPIMRLGGVGGCGSPNARGGGRSPGAAMQAAVRFEPQCALNGPSGGQPPPPPVPLYLLKTLPG